jgi:hypothetical protein
MTRHRRRIWHRQLAIAAACLVLFLDVAGALWVFQSYTPDTTESPGTPRTTNAADHKLDSAQPPVYPPSTLAPSAKPTAGVDQGRQTPASSPAPRPPTDEVGTNHPAQPVARNGATHAAAPVAHHGKHKSTSNQTKAAAPHKPAQHPVRPAQPTAPASVPPPLVPVPGAHPHRPTPSHHAHTHSHHHHPQVIPHLVSPAVTQHGHHATHAPGHSSGHSHGHHATHTPGHSSGHSHGHLGTHTTMTSHHGSNQHGHGSNQHRQRHSTHRGH